MPERRQNLPVTRWYRCPASARRGAFSPRRAGRLAGGGLLGLVDLLLHRVDLLLDLGLDLLLGFGIGVGRPLLGLQFLLQS